MKIISNSTELELSMWEGYGKQRVYIKAKLGVLGHELYFDVDKKTVFVKNGNKPAGRSWRVVETEKGFRVTSNAHEIDCNPRLNERYFEVEI